MSKLPNPRSKIDRSRNSIRVSPIMVVVCLGLMVIGGSKVSAASLADYHRRVTEAADTLSKLGETSAANSVPREQRIHAALLSVRESLPAKETVTADSFTTDVDNAWLREALDAYEKSSASEQLRSEQLSRVAERLRALDQRLTELETAKQTADSKDEEKARMAAILRRPEYNKTVEQGNAIERLWERFIRWLMSLLRRLFPDAKPLQPGSARAVSGIAQALVIALALALIAYVAWKLLPKYLRSRPKKKAKAKARIVLGERLEPDQTSADLLAQADAMARAGDLRPAIRKAYIALLCALGERKLISLEQHRTNRDYLYALRDTGLFNVMSPLTASFENHWYGFIPATPEDWSGFRAGYEAALRQ